MACCHYLCGGFIVQHCGLVALLHKHQVLDITLRPLALALSIAKAVKCRISYAYLFTDLTVLTLSLSYIPFKRIAYSLITVTLSSWIIDCFQKGKKNT